MKNWLIVVVLLLLGAAAYYYFGVSRSSAPDTGKMPPATGVISDTKPARIPLPEQAVPPQEFESGIDDVSSPTVEEIPLPMLMESDPVVLETLGGLVGEPTVYQYLVTDNVISRIVATVDTLGSRQVPGVVQAVQGPTSEFEAVSVDNPETVVRNEVGDEIPQFLIDPANYGRYTPYVETLEAVDTSSLVQSYRQHYPLFQEAFRQMGYTDSDFNERLKDIIDELLATPETSGPVTLVKPEAFYLFADPELESLSAGQKVLIRMGDSNASRVKSKLAEIRSAL